MENSLPLHLCHVIKSSLIINRLYFFLHGIALMALIYYRASFLGEVKRSHGITFQVCYALVFGSELLLSFLWLIWQSYRWRPVKRTEFPERLPEDDKLPDIDVFVCTADPNREPSLLVMNVVISAMALDYPPDKVHVYLSDDGGSSVTLKAIREAWKLATCWIPFCRKYGITTRCPEAYFSGNDESDGNLCSIDFIADKKTVQKQYDLFKEQVQWIKGKTNTVASKDHPPRIEVIKDVANDSMEENRSDLPLLVYVAREKRPFHHHHFKAGALNGLLRVSGVMSNSPYILVLDCDMYCNDSSSARQAMCFYLDNKINSNLAYVQFPQKFHNLSAKDIYDSQSRFFLPIQAYGADGTGGTVLLGTNCYIKREALYGTANIQEDADFFWLRKIYGLSNDFMQSIHKKNNISDKMFSSSLIKECEFLVSCTYEKETQWGEEVGYKNDIVEDYCTGLRLFGKGCKSVYLDPPKPSFLGSATTNLSDFLVQHTRWYSGLFRVAISKYSPIIFGPLRRQSIIRSMFFAQLTLSSLSFLPLWCLAIIPQLCQLHGISLYPGASDPFFIVFAFIFLSSNLKHIQEVLSDGHSIRSWTYEQRMWMIKSVTCYTYGSLNAIMNKIGLSEASFSPTNKVADEGQLKLYQSGIYDFRASAMLIVPICTLVILNVAALLLGTVKIFGTGKYDEMFIPIFISLFIVVIQYPVMEGMFFRKDSGRISQSAAVLSALLAAAILALGCLLFIY